jgi:hypothetical protein
MYLRQRCKEMVGMCIAVSVEQRTCRWQSAPRAWSARSKAQHMQGRSRASGGQQGGCGASGERERGERNASPPAVCATAAGAQSSSDGPSGRRRAAPGSSAMALLCMRASSADDCAALCCSRHGQGPWCRPREQQRRAARWRQGRLRQGRRVRRERTCPAAGSAAESCSMDVRTMGQRGWATGAAERCCHGRARRARPPLPFVWAGARCRAACCEEWRGGSSINTAEPSYACVVRSAASMRPVRLV